MDRVRGATALTVFLLVVAVACEPSTAPPEAERAGEMVPVYFIDGHGLTAVYKSLPSGDPADGLFELLKGGPERDDLRSLLPEAATLVASTETESDESLRLQIHDAFWDMPAGERFAAAAQIVYTYASLEEGKRVLLMEGTVPGVIEDGSGMTLDQPLSTDSFGDLSPWVQVQQPVPGATVGRSFPVVARVRPGTTAEIEVIGSNGEPLGSPRELDPSTVVKLEPAHAGSVTLRIIVRDGGAKHTTEMPLEVVP
jgi:hypothetical protein